MIGRAARDTLAVIVAYVPVRPGARRHAGDRAPAAAGRVVVLAAAVRRRGQLLAVQMLGAGAGSAVLVVLGALVVNARMLLYSAALAPHTAAGARGGGGWAAYLLADPVYALATTRFAGTHTDGPRERLALLLHRRAGALARVAGG